MVPFEQCDHDSTVNAVDKDCLLELAGIVRQTGAEVEDILKTTQRFIDKQIAAKPGLVRGGPPIEPLPEKNTPLCPWGKDTQAGQCRTIEVATLDGGTTRLQPIHVHEV